MGESEPNRNKTGSFRKEVTEIDKFGKQLKRNTGFRVNSVTGQREIKGSYGGWRPIDSDGSLLDSESAPSPCYNIDSG